MKKFLFFAGIIAVFSGLFFLAKHFSKAEVKNETKPEVREAFTMAASAAAISPKDYYVSDAGNDLNNGLSPAASLKTIQKAVELSQTGDKIYLSDNIYLIVNKQQAVANNPGSAAAVSTAASCPAQVLNLTNWKQTLPIGSKNKPTEILQNSLATYSNESCFRLNPAGDGVVFRAPVNGVTTSGSGYPRSELREMANNGKKLANWSTKSGTHTMFIEEAINAVPKAKKHVVAAQIHGPSDDIIAIRLEYPRLFVDINGKSGPTLDANYTLGKKFTVKFVAEKGQIKVYYNGNQLPNYTLKKNTSGCYFKAGAYTQSNCSKEKDCSSNNYGEVTIYKLDVQHS